MIYSIYKASSPSGKCYIGLTNNFNRRKADHIYKALDISIKNNKYNTRFKAAIRKYGANKIIWSIIDEAKDIETAKELEKRYILHFNSHNHGYNMTTGGDSTGNTTILWTKDKIKLESLRFKTLNEWKKQSKGSYDAAKRYKKDDELFYIKTIEHMPQMNKWTIENITNEIRKYSNMNAFKENCPSGYSSFMRQKTIIGEEVFSHMTRIYSLPYSREEILNEAHKHKTKANWRKVSESTYKKALKDKDFFIKCTNHMK